MIPHSITAWTALVHDRYLADTVEFLHDNPFGLKLEVLVEKTVNQIVYSGTVRHLAADDRRFEPSRLWTTNAKRIPLEQGAGASPSRDAVAGPRRGDGQRARPLVQC
jgi:hypothetical protein